MEYIQETGKDEGDERCVFCTIPELEADRVLAQEELAYVVLNKFPYNPGHVLVVPVRHVGDLTDLSAAESESLQSLVQRSVEAIRAEAEPHGFNVGMNLGRPAGAGIPDHLHWHVVPRWSGDTNFMPVVGQTRVLPELLAETARRLTPRFAR
jgi:Diadenosine tetraphosphate (Ap4A) hydrolase and other HIT family hydrolases